MRRGTSMAEALVAIAIAGGVMVLAMTFWNAGHRLFGRVQGTLEVEGEARILLINLVRDLSEAHRVRPSDPGEVLRVVRYLPDQAADFTSRTAAAYVNGAPAGDARDRSFAAQEIRYVLDPTKKTVTRRESDGTWHFIRPATPDAPVKVRFDPTGTPRAKEMARNVTLLRIEPFGYDRAGKLDLIARLPAEDLPYQGDEATQAATALAVIRLTARMDVPSASAADAPRELDVVTRVWLERHRAGGIARPFEDSADELPFR
jgi:hypothetical protein